MADPVKPDYDQVPESANSTDFDPNTGALLNSTFDTHKVSALEKHYNYRLERDKRLHVANVVTLIISSIATWINLIIMAVRV